MSEANNPSPAATAHWIHWDQERSAEEAESAFNETGLTPRQLVEQRDVLVAAIEELLSDVKYDNCGDGYAEAVIHSQDVSRARAAIGLVKGEPK